MPRKALGPAASKQPWDPARPDANGSDLAKEAIRGADGLPLEALQPSAADADQSPPLPRWLVAAGVGAMVIVFFVLLGTFPLSEPDETRYAEIPREMIERGDWITPHLNYVKYFEKPPLVYWLTAVSFTIFGMNELAARWLLGLFSLTGVAVAYGLGRSIYGHWTGCAAAALLAATPLYFGIGQFLTLDMPLSTFMTLGLGSYWFAYRHPERRRLCVMLLYVATALGVLTKGLIAAVLTAGVIGTFLLLRADARALRWTVSPVGMLVFLLVVLPWFVLVSTRNPEFLHFFIIDQHIRRYVQGTDHPEPFWFYAPILLGGTLPWSAFVLLTPGWVVRWLRRLIARRIPAGELYLLLWCAVVFVFFSITGSKVGTYVLPMCCPLAVLGARFFAATLSNRRDYVLRRGYVLILTVGVIAVLGSALTPLIEDDARVLLVASRVLPSGAILAIAAVVSLALLRRQARLGSLALMWFAVLGMQLCAVSGRAVAGDFVDIGEAIRTQSRADDLVVSYKHYLQGTNYYGRRRIVQAVGHGELEFGSTQGDQSAYFWPSDQNLVSAWASGRRLFLIINRGDLETLRSRLQPPAREIAAEGRKVVVVNFPDQ
jgi:4-amino-4-deoxy-L-arabinose transferase-like glycosyltransferase